VSRVIYISDFLLEDIVGGGELNDYELCKLLSDSNKEVLRIRSHDLMPDHISESDFYIVSNFINLRSDVKAKLQSHCNYVIYEHDHKYLRSRNPALYKNYVAPPDQIINKSFYEGAIKVFCQSSFHENIINDNISLMNLHNVSGNLWSEDSLSVMRILSRKEKRDCYSILNSSIDHKNTRETSFYCEKKGYKYDAISSNNYSEFLSLLSNNDKFIFLPKTPETLSRVVVEARMMNIKTFTNKRVGASYEDWFNLKGEELIDLMIEKKTHIKNLFLELM